MAINENKRKSNFIIALGYCLVAAIILFNYVRGSGAQRSEKLSAKYASQNKSNESVSYLRKQLNEEKKLNNTMRSALKTYQRAIKHTSIPSEQFQQLTQQNIDNTIPELNLFTKSIETKSPFSPDKNPFLSFKKRHSYINKTIHTQKSIYTSLKSNPRIPFITAGSNDTILFTGN